MIIQLSASISPNQKESIVSLMTKLGYKSNEVKTQQGHYLVGIGKKEIDLRALGHLPGITDIHRVSDDYKLVSRKWKVERSRIDLGDGVVIGNGSLSIMAGACSIETEEQGEANIPHLVKKKGGLMR